MHKCHDTAHIFSSSLLLLPTRTSVHYSERPIEQEEVEQETAGERPNIRDTRPTWNVPRRSPDLLSCAHLLYEKTPRSQRGVFSWRRGESKSLSPLPETRTIDPRTRLLGAQSGIRVTTLDPSRPSQRIADRVHRVLIGYPIAPTRTAIKGAGHIRGGPQRAGQLNQHAWRDRVNSTASSSTGTHFLAGFRRSSWV